MLRSRPRLLLLGVAPLLLLATAGCPGRLEDPERFGGDAVGTCTLDVEKTLLPTSCGGGGCHGASKPAANLDLESQGVGRRLVGVPSACGGKPLVSAGTSYFLEKLEPDPECGAQMPVGAELSAYERGCLAQYVQGLLDGGTQ
ncbi:hypothetical protein FGE12_18705 [Aggregicoccus sp. 17bor-14]|uniref:hypothetical protein n=1 Tax=Myxococcaceae TaxID=31 RepID=UPI0012F2080C|nr:MULTISPECIES: hypothetical protein [Myxococcaceae]MBF5044437.1 hypothetical protein [Simulacricoccus sp. 17bor-14]MRI90183.1 hypothetical protein [Aggregicoccus sp. 17bor-14]